MENPAVPRAVLVTGASTGIGRAAAIHLAERGFRVFAGYRRDEDGAALGAGGGGITPVRVDVTDAASIAAARASIGDALGDSGLHGLVNNAGIVVSGPLEFLPLDAIRLQFEVNLFGHVAVTQSFLSLLRRASGRVINMSSISGRVASPMLGPYAMSKFALEAFSDSLRRELAPWNLPVVCIEPGAIDTPIWSKSRRSADDRIERLPEEAVALYGARIDGLKRAAKRMADDAVSTENVSAVVYRALTAKRPRTRYVVGPDAKWGARIAWLLPDRVLDFVLNRSFGGS